MPTRRHRKIKGGTHNAPFFTEHTAKNGPRVISGVPLAIYQSWVTNTMPPKMRENMNALLKTNPEFDHYLYSHERCLQFIKDNYPQKVVDAYKSLKPGAYKSDLWRYCILYKLGGVYLDVKFYTAVPIVNLLEKHPEIYSRDTVAEYTDEAELKCKWKPAVYNGFLVTPPNNKIFKDCINEIVKNCQKRDYTNSILHITGPCLLGRLVKKYKGESFIDEHNFHFVGVNENGIQMGNIKQGDETIIKQYPEYRDELSGSKVEHYTNMWRRKNVFQGGTRKQRGGSGKIVFTLTNTTGFGSMAHFLTQAYLHAKKNGKEFYIENNGWQYGNWHEYFKTLKNVDTTVTPPITRYMHASKIENSSLQEHNNAMKEIFVPTDEIVAAANEFKEEIGGPYKAIYVRRGDKTSGTEMENPPIELKPLLEKNDINAGDNLFVMSDDHAVVEEIRGLLPGVKIFTMTRPESMGADRETLQTMSPEKMKEHARELFTSLQVVLGSTKAWVDNRSNLGRFMKLASPDTMILYPLEPNHANINGNTLVNPGFEAISA
jgi:hypothetical protein